MKKEVMCFVPWMNLISKEATYQNSCEKESN